MNTVCSGPVHDIKSSSTAITAGVVVALAGALIIVGIILGLLWKRKKDRAKLVGRFDNNLAEGIFKSAFICCI